MSHIVVGAPTRPYRMSHSVVKPNKIRTILKPQQQQPVQLTVHYGSAWCGLGESVALNNVHTQANLDLFVSVRREWCSTTHHQSNAAAHQFWDVLKNEPKKTKKMEQWNHHKLTDCQVLTCRGVVLCSREPSTLPCSHKRTWRMPFWMKPRHWHDHWFPSIFCPK